MRKGFQISRADTELLSERTCRVAQRREIHSILGSQYARRLHKFSNARAVGQFQSALKSENRRTSGILNKSIIIGFPNLKLHMQRRRRKITGIA